MGRVKHLDKNLCTNQITGYIYNRVFRGSDFPTSIVVGYVVNNVSYQITESVEYERKAVKIKGIPIGQKRVPMVGSIQLGNPIKVAYSPANPREAYLVDNQGKDNI